jgi:hypothetical protein
LQSKNAQSWPQVFLALTPSVKWALTFCYMYFAENVYLNKWSDSPSKMEQIILDEILFNPDQWKCTYKSLRDNLKYFLTRLGVYPYSSEVFSWERIPTEGHFHRYSTLQARDLSHKHPMHSKDLCASQNLRYSCVGYFV